MMRTVPRFKTVFIDIVGGCNASCTYCLSGRYGPRGLRFLDPAVLDEVLRILSVNEAVVPNMVFGLYNWGEPFLHPQLSKIVKVVAARKHRYAFSTNASHVPEITPEFVDHLDHIVFSMPGFSEASYERISRLNFERVTANIETIVRCCRASGFRGRFVVAYHVYQFNISEMRACETFSGRLGLEFEPCKAMLNHWTHINAWIDGTLSHDAMKQVARDLLMDDVDEKMRQAPAGYECPQRGILVIDEQANVITCCQTPKEPPYICGNLLRDSLEDIMQRRDTSEVCRECIGRGLAYYFHNALGPPDFFQPRAGMFAKTAASGRFLLRRLRAHGKGHEGNTHSAE